MLLGELAYRKRYTINMIYIHILSKSENHNSNLNLKFYKIFVELY